MAESRIVPFLKTASFDSTRNRKRVFVDQGRKRARSESVTANREGGELDSASNQLRATERGGEVSNRVARMQQCEGWHPCYSVLSASTGFTLVARSTGMVIAASVTMIIVATAVAT